MNFATNSEKTLGVKKWNESKQKWNISAHDNAEFLIRLAEARKRNICIIIPRNRVQKCFTTKWKSIKQKDRKKTIEQRSLSGVQINRVKSQFANFYDTFYLAHFKTSWKKVKDFFLFACLAALWSKFFWAVYFRTLLQLSLSCGVESLCCSRVFFRVTQKDANNRRKSNSLASIAIQQKREFGCAEKIEFSYSTAIECPREIGASKEK